MDYLFVNGAIKAKTFLSENQFTLLSQSKREYFVKTLNDFNYGYTANKQTLDNLLRQEEEKLVKELEFWLGNTHNLIICYKFLNDLNNIKIIFKETLKSPAAFFNELGNYSKGALVSALKNNNYSLVEKDYKLFQNLNKLSKELSPLETSNEISKEVYHYLYQNYIEKFNKQLKAYFQIRMTVINIQTIIRSMKLGFSYELIKKSLCLNALAEDNVLLDYLYDKKTPEGLKFHLPDYFNKVLSSVNYQDLNDFNQEVNNMISMLMSSFDFHIEGLAPVLSYVVKKKNEMNRIRNIYYIHKSNNLLGGR